MTNEQRQERLCYLASEQLRIKNEMSELQKEQRNQEQQDCLQWVGRAFSSGQIALLVTSVPPIKADMILDHFNKYQFPCIYLSLDDYSPPVFDDTCFIKDGRCSGFSWSAGDYEEISFKEFQDYLTKRINDILKLAATAKMRQAGKEVWSYRDGEICEK